MNIILRTGANTTQKKRKHSSNQRDGGPVRRATSLRPPPASPKYRSYVSSPSHSSPASKSGTVWERARALLVPVRKPAMCHATLFSYVCIVFIGRRGPSSGVSSSTVVGGGGAFHGHFRTPIKLQTPFACFFPFLQTQPQKGHRDTSC